MFVNPLNTFALTTLHPSCAIETEIHLYLILIIVCDCFYRLKSESLNMSMRNNICYNMNNLLIDLISSYNTQLFRQNIIIKLLSFIIIKTLYLILINHYLSI